MSEREFSPSASEPLIREAIASLQLVETVQFANTTETVAHCLLHTKSGKLVSEGAGKGRYCLLGALGESIEHYIMQSAIQTFLTTSSEVRTQPSLALDGIIANLPKEPKQLECVLMEDMLTGALVKLPAVILQPDSDLARFTERDGELSYLTRYATNSGSAFGCSENEAILHGLNETIERHTLSTLLMALCGQHDNLELNRVGEDSLDDVFSDVRLFVPKAREMKILIYKSIFGPYFSIALPKRPLGRYPICPIGSGCSINPRIAVQRSTTELTQAIDLFDAEGKFQDEKAYDLLDPSPRLRNMITLDHVRNRAFKTFNFPAHYHLTVTEQIQVITQALSRTGHSILKRCVARLPNGCSVSQVYVPGFERFNLIRLGLPVVPQRHLLASRIW